MERLPNLEEIEVRVKRVNGVRCSLCEGCTGKRGEVSTGVVYGADDVTAQRCAVWSDQPIESRPVTVDFLFTEDYLYAVEFESISDCNHWLAFKIKWSAALDAIDLEVD